MADEQLEAEVRRRAMRATTLVRRVARLGVEAERATRLAWETHKAHVDAKREAELAAQRFTEARRELEATLGGESDVGNVALRVSAKEER